MKREIHVIRNLIINSANWPGSPQGPLLLRLRSPWANYQVENHLLTPGRALTQLYPCWTEIKLESQ